MELKHEDFKDLQYNIHGLPEKESVLKKFPELNRFPEFTQNKLPGLDKDKVIRYIIYCYDKRCPFLSEKNLTKRKALCAIEAGIKLTAKDEFPAAVKTMLEGKNEQVNRMVIRFVRNQRDMKYALLVSGTETYYDNIAKIAAIEKDSDVADSSQKSVLFDKTSKLSEQLEALSDEVFNGDVEMIYTADEIAQEENGKIMSYPEFFANKKKVDDGEF